MQSTTEMTSKNENALPLHRINYAYYKLKPLLFQFEINFLRLK